MGHADSLAVVLCTHLSGGGRGQSCWQEAARGRGKVCTFVRELLPAQGKGGDVMPWSPSSVISTALSTLECELFGGIAPLLVIKEAPQVRISGGCALGTLQAGLVPWSQAIVESLAGLEGRARP